MLRVGLGAAQTFNNKPTSGNCLGEGKSLEQREEMQACSVSSCPLVLLSHPSLTGPGTLLVGLGDMHELR